MESSIRERRYQDILQAAAEEFSRCGFESARMDAIAKRAGIGKSTVYEYFPSKRELLRAVGDMMVTELLTRVREAVTADLPLHDLLSRYFRCTVELQSYIGTAMPMFQSGDEFCQEIESFARRFCTETTDLLHTMLVQAAERGEINRTNDLRTGALFLLCSASPVFAQNVQSNILNFDQASNFFLRALQ